MSTQPQQGEPPVLNASDRGVNPYVAKRGAMSKLTAPPALEAPYPAEAKGLDGDILDSILKARWREGKELGEKEGRALAAAQYQHVFDDGFMAGRQAGFAEADLTFSRQLVPRLQTAASTFAEIGQATGSQKIKELCGLQLQALRPVLDLYVGRHAAPTSEPERRAS